MDGAWKGPSGGKSVDLPAFYQGAPSIQVASDITLGAEIGANECLPDAIENDGTHYTVKQSTNELIKYSKSGVELWREIPIPGYKCYPMAQDDEVLYCKVTTSTSRSNQEDQMAAIYKSDGTIKWHNNDLYSSGVYRVEVVDDYLIGANSAALVAYNKLTGAYVRANGNTYYGFVVLRDRIYGVNRSYNDRVTALSRSLATEYGTYDSKLSKNLLNYSLEKHGFAAAADGLAFMCTTGSSSTTDSRYTKYLYDVNGVRSSTDRILDIARFDYGPTGGTGNNGRYIYNSAAYNTFIGRYNGEQKLDLLTMDGAFIGYIADHNPQNHPASAGIPTSPDGTLVCVEDTAEHDWVVKRLFKE